MVVDGGPDPGRLLIALDERLPPWDRRIDILVLTPSARGPRCRPRAPPAAVQRRPRLRARDARATVRGTGPGARSSRAAGRRTAGCRPAIGWRSTRSGFRVLWPDPNRVPERPPDGGTSINNVSIVLLGEVGAHRFLLAGRRRGGRRSGAARSRDARRRPVQGRAPRLARRPARSHSSRRCGRGWRSCRRVPATRTATRRRRRIERLASSPAGRTEPTRTARSRSRSMASRCAVRTSGPRAAPRPGRHRSVAERRRSLPARPAASSRALRRPPPWGSGFLCGVPTHSALRSDGRRTADRARGTAVARGRVRATSLESRGGRGCGRHRSARRSRERPGQPPRLPSTRWTRIGLRRPRRPRDALPSPTSGATTRTGSRRRSMRSGRTRPAFRTARRSAGGRRRAARARPPPGRDSRATRDGLDVRRGQRRDRPGRRRAGPSDRRPEALARRSSPPSLPATAWRSLEETDSGDGSRPSKIVAEAIRSGRRRCRASSRRRARARWRPGSSTRARERQIKLGPGVARELATRVGGFVREGDVERQQQGRVAVMELEKLALRHADDEPVTHRRRPGARRPRRFPARCGRSSTRSGCASAPGPSSCSSA